ASASYQLRTNGDFSAGSAGWAGLGASFDCPGRTGLAARLLAGPGLVTRIQQTITAGIAPGSYVLSGYAQLASGNGSATAGILWLDASGSLIRERTVPIVLSSTYGPFTLTEPASPSNARGVTVQLSAAS